MEGFLIASIYFILGLVISAAYTFLASGDIYHFIVTVLVAPPVVSFIIVTLSSTHHRRYSVKVVSMLKTTGVALILYFATPILCNAVSLVCEYFGRQELADTLFWLRYRTLFLLPITFLVMTIAISKIRKVVRKAHPS